MQFVVETEPERMAEVIRELWGATLVGERGVLLNLGMRDLRNAFKRWEAEVYVPTTPTTASANTVPAPTSPAPPSPQADGDGSQASAEPQQAIDPATAADWRGPLFREGRARG